MIKFKMFSGLSRSDMIDILVPRVISSAANAILNRNLGSFFSDVILGSTADIFQRLFRNKLNEFENKKLAGLSNLYLIDYMNRRKYKMNMDYTVNAKKPKVTMNLNNGIFMICLEKGANDTLVDFMKSRNTVITDMGKFTFISYQPNDKNSLDGVLDGVMKRAKKIDIYDNR